MPRTSERGGPQTRARIIEVAAPLFLERGFDDVTVAEIARAAGVSSVTVFNHFPRKEDLYLDRSAEAVALLQGAVRERSAGVDVLSALRALTLRLVDERAALSGVDPRSVPYFRTVAGSPALVARARGIAAELQAVLTEELARDPDFRGDATLLAAFFLAGYASVLTGTAGRLIAGEPMSGALVAEHRARFEQLFTALREGVAR
jgi:AcrR family transcriptional regulator